MTGLLGYAREWVKKQAAIPVPVVHEEPATPEDLEWFAQKSNEDSSFDYIGARSSLYNAHKNSQATLKVFICRYGRILVAARQGKQIPRGLLGLWAAILRAFGGGQQWRILWYAADEPRRFPRRGQAVSQANINGGYCMACDPRTVVIYRYEDATRVLIHELLHATCTDPLPHTEANVPLNEASTEAWAELLTALFREVGLGGFKPIPGAWRDQCAWAAAQNALLRDHHGVSGPEDYAWRYTLGKEKYMNAWCMGAGMPGLAAIQPRPTLNGSLRLTPPVHGDSAF